MPRRRPAGSTPPPLGFVRPMLATSAALSEVPVTSERLVYERKYDGMRALAALAPGAPRAAAASVTIWSRNGADKTAQFPEVASALAVLASTAGRALLVDGEIVALDERRQPAGFSRLQPRMHLTDARAVAEAARRRPVAFIAFDLIRDGEDDLRAQPWASRRERLERILLAQRSRPSSRGGASVYLSEVTRGDARALVARAVREGWEGLIAKDVRSPYEVGRRSPFWRKLKLERRQEFVVGGFTEGRGARASLGALLVGVWEDTPGGGRRLRFAGGVGTGFDQPTLERLVRRLRAVEVPTSPFAGPVEAAGRIHWVRPSVVVEVRFAEWTPERRLRHPVFLGWREDKPAGEVVVEAPPAPEQRPPGMEALAPVLDRLQALEDAHKNGWIDLPDGHRLYVTNLSKVFWPSVGLTKGDLLRYYVEVSPFILPAVLDRPLVLKRFPDGVARQAFYQQRAMHPPPPGVRVECLPEGADPIREEEGIANPQRFVGGSLATLLYTAQLGAVSQDPWFSTVRAPLEPDQAALDLDPGPEATWSVVVDVARWVRDELARLGIPAVPKTSGSRGVHVYIALPPGTSYQSAMLLCQLVATLVSAKHPRHATTERAVARRPPRAVYVDYLQNMLGKTLATAYSARASAHAGVSTPLAWHELDEGIDARAFTLRTAVARFREVGDLWAGLRTGQPVDLREVLERAGRGA